MKDKGNNEKCPHCGESVVKNDRLCLPPGTEISDRYILGRAIARGGFSITYLAYDRILDRRVAVKEYLPADSASRNATTGRVVSYSGGYTEQYDKGLERFMEEAEHLSKYKHIDAVVDIYDVEKNNNTAYIIMEYLEGQSLQKYLESKSNKRISYEEAVNLMMPVMDALEILHKDNLIHRDISPDNIILTEDGSVKLIDFGASRYAATGYSKSLTSIIKPGYSPLEQYSSDGNQGPWTDIYGLSATLYKMITGMAPQPSIEREIKDTLVEPSKVPGVEIDENAETTIMNGLIGDERIRPYRDMESFRAELMGVIEAKRIKIVTADMRHKRNVRRAILGAATVALVFVLLMLTGVLRLKPKLAIVEVAVPENMVNVPNIISLDIEGAGSALKDNQLNLMIIDKQYDDNIPRGKVLYQAPMLGKLFIKGQDIRVVISLGPEDEAVHEPDTMPDIEYQAEEKIVQVLKEYGINYEIVMEDSTMVDFGKVIKTEPPAGAPIGEGKTAVVYISNGKEIVDVPDITGQNWETAKDTLEKSGFIVQIKKQYSPDVVENKVIYQEPEDKASKGALITICYSLGRGEGKLTSVPDVVGMTEKKAFNEFEKAVLSLEVARIFDDEIAEGIVMSQDTKSGSQLPQFSVVKLVISKGENPKNTVPDVEGKLRETAVKHLEEAGFRVVVAEENSLTTTNGYVISQTNKGAELRKDTEISIVVSIGPKSVEVPNLIGKPDNEAKSILGDLGLNVSTSKEYSLDVDSGLVISQSPTYKSIVDEQSVVSIIISSGARQIEVPNVMGKTQSIATNMIENKSLQVKITEEYSTDYNKGKVLYQNPSSGGTVDEQSSIEVVVGKGPGEWVEVYQLPTDVRNNPDYEVVESKEYRYRDLQHEISGFSAWSSEHPSDINVYEIKERYHTKEKEYTWNTATSISGWTATGNERWTGNYTAYSAWSSWSTTSVSETELRDVETKTQYHYTRGIWWWADMGYWSSTYSLTYALNHGGYARYSGWMDAPWPVRGETDGQTKYEGTLELGTRSWWNQTTQKVYRYRTRTKILEYEHYRWPEQWSAWYEVKINTSPNSNSELQVEKEYSFNTRNEIWPSEYSAWSTTEYTSSDTREVDIRTIYKYRRIGE